MGKVKAEERLKNGAKTEKVSIPNGKGKEAKALHESFSNGKMYQFPMGKVKRKRSEIFMNFG